MLDHVLVKVEKQVFSFLLKIWPKMIYKYYGEIFERNRNNDRENFELIWNNDPKHTSNLAKSITNKNIVKE